MDHAPGGVWHAWYVMAGRMSLAGRGHRLGGGGLLDLDGALLLLPDLELGLAQGSLTSPAPARRGGRKGIGSVFEIALCMPFQCRVAIVMPSMASTSWIRHSIRMARLRATLVAATRRFRNLLSSFSRCVWHQVVGGDPWTDSGWCWCERLSPRGAPLPQCLEARGRAFRSVSFRKSCSPFVRCCGRHPLFEKLECGVPLAAAAKNTSTGLWTRSFANCDVSLDQRTNRYAIRQARPPGPSPRLQSTPCRAPPSPRDPRLVAPRHSSAQAKPPLLASSEERGPIEL